MARCRWSTPQMPEFGGYCRCGRDMKTLAWRWWWCCWWWRNEMTWWCCCCWWWWWWWWWWKTMTCSWWCCWWTWWTDMLMLLMILLIKWHVDGAVLLYNPIEAVHWCVFFHVLGGGGIQGLFADINIASVCRPIPITGIRCLNRKPCGPFDKRTCDSHMCLDGTTNGITPNHAWSPNLECKQPLTDKSELLQPSAWCVQKICFFADQYPICSFEWCWEVGLISTSKIDWSVYCPRKSQSAYAHNTKAPGCTFSYQNF